MYAHMYATHTHSVQKQQVRSLETEIDNYRKSTTLEQERNEQLTLMLNKVHAMYVVLSSSDVGPSV